MRPSRASRLSFQCLITLAATSVMAYVGGRRLAAPPLLYPTKMMSWWSAAGPVVGAMSVLWAVSVLIGAYWVVLCAVTMVARSSGRIMWLVRLRLPGTARLLRATAGASMLGATIVAASGCGIGGAATRSSAGRAPAPPVLLPVAGASTAVPVGLPGSPQPETPAPALQSPAGTAQQPPALAVGAVRDMTKWTVKPGDDLWSISETVLTGRLGYRPDDRQIASLWLRVIEANRTNLADPANPNLIFAGEVVDIPG